MKKSLEDLIEQGGLVDVLDILSEIEKETAENIGLSMVGFAYRHFGIATGLKVLSGIAKEME